MVRTGTAQRGPICTHAPGRGDATRNECNECKHTPALVRSSTITSKMCRANSRVGTRQMACGWSAVQSMRCRKAARQAMGWGPPHASQKEIDGIITIITNSKLDYPFWATRKKTKIARIKINRTG